jgi:hypothetical protein
VKKQRAKWQKKGRDRDVEKPVEQSPSADKHLLDGNDPLPAYLQEGSPSDDSDSDDEIGRDGGSPVLKADRDQKFQKLIKES